MVKTHCPAVGVPHVEPCDPAELQPLIDWLGRGEHCAEPLAFPRGTVLPDGRLDLCKQAVGPDGARRVLDAARGHPAIRSILLGTGAIGDTGAATPIGDNVETLYAGCNRITATGVRALSNHVGSLHALWLKRNPLGEAGAHAIAELLPRAPKLRVLDLFNCELGDAGVAIVADALASSTVEHVYLGGNGAGVRAAEALARVHTLRSLDLGASPLGDAGARALADTRTLESLALANCDLGTVAITSPSLTELDLGEVAAARALGAAHNHIGDAGAPAIADWIAASPQLRVLDLRGNGITSHGAFAIAAAVERSASLVALGLHFRVAKSIRRRIRAVVASNGPPPGLPAHVRAILSVYRGSKLAGGGRSGMLS